MRSQRDKTDEPQQKTMQKQEKLFKENQKAITVEVKIEELIVLDDQDNRGYPSSAEHLWEQH